MNKVNTNDALGNPIVIGNDYGYFLDSNGSGTLVFGTAENVNTETGKVRLRRYYSGISIYSDAPYNVDLTVKAVSVKALKLFPVERSQIKRLEQ